MLRVLLIIGLLFFTQLHCFAEEMVKETTEDFGKAADLQQEANQIRLTIDQTALEEGISWEEIDI